MTGITLVISQTPAPIVGDPGRLLFTQAASQRPCGRAPRRSDLADSLSAPHFGINYDRERAMSMIRLMRGVRRRANSWLTTYRPGPKPNIAVFAIRRGGSTLLADMLATEPGVLLVDEPFNTFEANTNVERITRWLTPGLHSEFFELDDEDRERVRAYLTALLEGTTGLGTCPYPKFPFRADRVLLKILHVPRS